jgi:hypothetical protein
MNAPPDERNAVNPDDTREAEKEEPMLTQSPQSSEPASEAEHSAAPQSAAGSEAGFGKTAESRASRAWSSATDPRRKSVALATVLSLMPGLGQIYVGYYQLGFIYVLIFASLVTILASGAGALDPLFGLSLGFFILYNLVDAGRRAALYNLALDNATTGQLPRVEFPVNRGSRVGGVVILGIYLFMKDRQSRKRID